MVNFSEFWEIRIIIAVCKRDSLTVWIPLGHSARSRHLRRRSFLQCGKTWEEYLYRIFELSLMLAFAGRRYKIQEEFEDGCESRCVCDATEFISCSPRCARDLGDLDDTCKLLSHPKDQCCQIPSCSEHSAETPSTDASSESGCEKKQFHFES